MRLFNTKTDLETLMIVPCSKSSAEQRAGRAGRVRPGKCFRLYSEAEFEKLLNTTVPEIQRGDLSNVILKLKALGVQNILKFNYISVRFYYLFIIFFLYNIYLYIYILLILIIILYRSRQLDQ